LRLQVEYAVAVGVVTGEGKVLLATRAELVRRVGLRISPRLILCSWCQRRGKNLRWQRVTIISPFFLLVFLQTLCILLFLSCLINYSRVILGPLRFCPSLILPLLTRSTLRMKAKYAAPVGVVAGEGEILLATRAELVRRVGLRISPRLIHCSWCQRRGKSLRWQVVTLLVFLQTLCILFLLARLAVR
jgi:hypothetical protein